MSGVSIITCTHVPYFINNIFDNYSRQTHSEKELILILNNRALHYDEWSQKSQYYPNVRIFVLDENISVGSCMNFAIKQANYDYIANFDHDDYYGPLYLDDYVYAVQENDAGLFGKKSHYVYFEQGGTLALMHPGYENCYVDYVDGRTMFFKKNIIDTVQFIDNNISDCQFSRDCFKNGIKIFSVNRLNFAYIRRGNSNSHTWDIGNTELLNNHCWAFGSVDDFKPYVEVDIT